MNNNDIPRKIIDITGVELTPAEPAVCLGNGEQGFECCCDECDYFLLCFPGFDSKSETINKTEIPPPYDVINKKEPKFGSFCFIGWWIRILS